MMALDFFGCFFAKALKPFRDILVMVWFSGKETRQGKSGRFSYPCFLFNVGVWGWSWDF